MTVDPSLTANATGEDKDKCFTASGSWRKVAKSGQEMTAERSTGSPMAELKQIRVAHITATDGSLRYLLVNQLRRIAGEGYHVEGVSSRGPHVPFLEANGIRHVAIRIKRRISPLADLRALFLLVRYFRRERIDIVHTHTPKPGLVGQLAAKIAGVPIVVNTLHGFYFTSDTPRWRRWLLVTLEKIAGRCSDLVLSQNSEDIETAVSEKILPVERIQFLGNGIDLERFSRDKLDLSTLTAMRRKFDLGKGPVVGFLGRHVREKGLLELFAAMKIVREQIPGVQLLSVGRIDNDRGDAVSPQVAEDFGVGDICHFVGVQQDVPHVMALLNVFVLPSHREGFPRSPMEAAAMGVPVIVTDIRGCRATVEDGYNGLLVPVKEPKALGDAIVKLLSDQPLARRLGKNGMAKAAKQFDEQVVFDRVLNAYRLLIEQKLAS